MILGITGISGAGKHTAGSILARRGWVVLDVDAMAHAAYRPYTSVWKAIVEAFGEKILNKDDTINRQMLGKIVFSPSDPEASQKALATLDEIVHPYLRHRLEDEVHYQSRKGADVAVVAALWGELGLIGMCEKLLLVTAGPKICSERICKRDGISPQEYGVRVRGYSMPPSADFTVENNGSPEEFGVALVRALGR